MQFDSDTTSSIAFSLICMVISWVLNEFGFKKISWVLNKFLSLLLVFIYCIRSGLSDCSGAHLFINLLVHLRVCVDFGTDSLTLIQWRIKWKSVVTKKVKETKKGQITLSSLYVSGNFNFLFYLLNWAMSPFIFWNWANYLNYLINTNRTSTNYLKYPYINPLNPYFFFYKYF